MNVANNPANPSPTTKEQKKKLDQNDDQHHGNGDLAQQNRADPMDNADHSRRNDDGKPPQRNDGPKSLEDDHELGKNEQHYSTRGRHHSKESADVPEPATERGKGHRDYHEENEQPLKESKDQNTTTTSFLDSLGEEEKRTRTRHLPAVDGIHILGKSEVKHDLALARSIMSSSGVSTLSRRTRGKRAHQTDDGSMEVDDVEMIDQSEDERSSDVNGLGGISLLLKNAVSIPSRAFVAPPDTAGSTTEGTDGDGMKKPSHPARSPHVVEAVSTFNPPRPPESVGPKKKHRMLRWESRPQDVEVDLTNYRKTVQRTREELRNAQGERERIESVAAKLRSNFLTHLQALNLEGAHLNDEFSAVQSECVKAADLLTSRTRSRGVGKGSYVMKDVLSILKQKGAEVEENGPTESRDPVYEYSSGMGGVDKGSFSDWDGSTKFEACKAGNGWVLVGDMVETPYGSGTILHVYPPTHLDVNSPPVAAASKGVDSLPTEVVPKAVTSAPNFSIHGFRKPTIGPRQGGLVNGLGPSPTNGSRPGEVKSNDQATTMKPSSDMRANEVLPPRVCVRLAFGVGYFPISAVKSKVDTSALSDSALASRWRKMVGSALSVGSCLDAAALSTVMIGSGSSASTSKPRGDAKMAEDDDCADDGDHDGNDNEAHDAAHSKRILPYAADMLPTASGRGNVLADTPIQVLEKGMHGAVFNGSGVLGKRDNRGVPEGFRKWEKTKEDLCLLRAQVLQRRNELNRQRRIRLQNERAFAAARDRASKIETLVSEMRADLKSLKDRLDDELSELGIDGESAEGLLTSFYQENDTVVVEETAPPKRKSRPAKDPSRAAPKQTRRRAADEGNFAAYERPSGNAEPMEDAQVHTSEEDGGEPQRSHKRSRPNQ